MKPFRNRVPSLVWTIIVAFFLGGAEGIHLVSLESLSRFPVFQDGIQAVAGQRYFLNDVWHWPLLDTKFLFAPKGASVAMTGSTPLLLLLFKPFLSLLPVGFVPYRLWLIFCFVMQAVSAVLALSAAGERRILALISGAVMALCMPFFLGRIIYLSLMGQFLILLAFGTIASSFLTLLWMRRKEWHAVACTCAGSAALIFVISKMLGYFRYAQGAGGYGLFSMNFLSPIWPMHSDLLRHFPALHYGLQTQSFEGYVYLGGGASWSSDLRSRVLQADIIERGKVTCRIIVLSESYDVLCNFQHRICGTLPALAHFSVATACRYFSIEWAVFLAGRLWSVDCSYPFIPCFLKACRERGASSLRTVTIFGYAFFKDAGARSLECRFSRHA